MSAPSFMLSVPGQRPNRKDGLTMRFVHTADWQLGMTRETFSRILATMERYGLHIFGDTVEVADAAPLRARFHLDPLIDGPEPIVPFPPRRH